jgi:hypothetical protein
MGYGDLQGITLEKSDQSFAGPRSEEVGFAHDSALEEDGFELSVPQKTSSVPGRLRFPFGILAVAGTLLMINGYFLLVHLPLE